MFQGKKMKFYLGTVDRHEEATADSHTLHTKQYKLAKFRFLSRLAKTWSFSQLKVHKHKIQSISQCRTKMQRIEDTGGIS